ncbi:hypothetical protein K353_05232 [Kitasatospora sp. SolWspMP-SS2h]|uniref:hypothetical protein n=1 Tax=Kitasatospora sp. SolWspMP-SS2h TaxID=1305729 RepID=UPI000DBA54C3|nr:hypothetical protein [Kitasatospora sp. SolWspMP-SS2h]RAJ34586.1 hypothetical protein K353_05232 [Kitasatospora sp. SolWspMP-SS2h]
MSPTARSRLRTARLRLLRRALRPVAPDVADRPPPSVLALSAQAERRCGGRAVAGTDDALPEAARRYLP